MSVNRLFVIGLDGVDITIAREHDMLLSSHVEWDLSEFPKLHTLRIWPSMYVGNLVHESPDLPDPLGHKVFDGDEEEMNRANWYSPRMRLLSQIAHVLLPQAVRKPLGTFLEEGGHVKTEPDREDWPDTVFDGLLSKGINLPAYNPLPIQRQLKSGWRSRIETGDSGLEELEELADREREEVREALSEALKRGYDLTWAYAFNPDIFGHVDYDYSYPRQTAKTWEEVVQPVYDGLDDGDELVVVTDHGMEEQGGVGEHRPPGWLATTANTDDLPESPQEVRAWIEHKVGRRSQRKEETLRDLGYI